MRKPLPNRLKTGFALDKKSSCDIWLTRLSHMSQIGILVVAIIGYFYTVVPLYQKSILDEEIANKELKINKNKILGYPNFTKVTANSNWKHSEAKFRTPALEHLTRSPGLISLTTLNYLIIQPH